MYNVAFAGFRHGHIYMLYEQCKNSPLVNIAGSFEENDQARRDAENNGVEFKYETYEDILNDKNVDIVAVGDYYGIRGERAIKALEAGKHVILDKPICISLKELDKIEQLAKEKNLCVGSMLSLRYNSYTAVIKDIIDTGKLGEIRAVSFNGQHSLSYGERPMWYFEKGKHGGVINDISVHGIDLIEYFTGARLKKVNAAREWNAYAKEVPDFKDCSQFMIELTNGAGVIADVSYAVPSDKGYDVPFYWQFIIWGDNGIIKFSDNRKTVEFYPEHSQCYQCIDGEEAPTNHITDFVHEIEGQKDLLICTEQVIASQRDTLLIQKAAKEGN